MPDTTTETDNVTREVTIDAPLEDVWEAVSTDEGRERWLEPDDDRTLVVEEAEPPSHISWWWWHESDNEPARHVDVSVVAVPDGGTRVTVTETQPTMVPIAQLRGELRARSARERSARTRIRRARRPDAAADARHADARGLDLGPGADRGAADHAPGGRQAPLDADGRRTGRARTGRGTRGPLPPAARRARTGGNLDPRGGRRLGRALGSSEDLSGIGRPA